MIEHLRRKNLSESAEAAVEVGRLLYLLGRHGEGLQKFDEAIEADGDRDQTYIDVIAFLVQHGETDAALGIHHRAPVASRPRGVRIRQGLHLALGARSVAPHEQDRRSRRRRRSCARSIAATATCARAAAPPGITCSRATRSGSSATRQMLAAADTTGKRAEIYFYEGMRRLARRQVRRRAPLWQKVIETRMFSFFEFDMASRYLRLGAPTAPRSRSPAPPRPKRSSLPVAHTSLARTRDPRSRAATISRLIRTPAAACVLLAARSLH